MTTAAPLRVAWHWFTMGPYHYARMRAVQRRGVELTVIETTHHDDHHWYREPSATDLHVVSLASGQKSESEHRASRTRYVQTLRDLQPDIVVESGYGIHHARDVALEYRREHPSSLAIVWSETTLHDHARHWWLEHFKADLLTSFDAAFVAGTPHARYFESLGFPSDRIVVVGNCVDNDWFRTRSDEARLAHSREGLDIEGDYFLYVGRFIREKNLGFLLRAFDEYRKQARENALDLVLVGDGPEGVRLRRQAAAIPGVRFVGLRQARAVAMYYAFARALVLPSTSEPWGLVVNEAMACGLPILVSDRCGCVEDLVVNGETGYIFDPRRQEQLVQLLLRVGAAKQEAAEMGGRGQQRIANFGVDRFAERVDAHCQWLYRAGRVDAHRPPVRRPKGIGAIRSVGQAAERLFHLGW